MPCLYVENCVRGCLVRLRVSLYLCVCLCESVGLCARVLDCLCPLLAQVLVDMDSSAAFETTYFENKVVLGCQHAKYARASPQPSFCSVCVCALVCVGDRDRSFSCLCARQCMCMFMKCM